MCLYVFKKNCPFHIFLFPKLKQNHTHESFSMQLSSRAFWTVARSTGSTSGNLQTRNHILVTLIFSNIKLELEAKELKNSHNGRTGVVKLYDSAPIMLHSL